jgi:HK97 family phage portal protein
MNLNPFKRRKSNADIFAEKVYNEMQELKSMNIYELLRSTLPGLIKPSSNIPFAKTILYYCSVSPAAKAIDLLTDEYASIEPIVWDRLDKKNVTDKFPELMNLLNKPNPDMTRKEFEKRVSAWRLITGNSYQKANGFLTKYPEEIEVIEPDRITPHKSDNDNYVDYYDMDVVSGNKVRFKRIETVNGFRFVNEPGKELWHIKSFNPGREPWIGMSKLNQVYYECEQHLKASIHNLSMLEKGARPSGMLAAEGDIGSTQKAELKEKFRAGVQGYQNAGDILILGGSKFTFTEMSKNMKDMDFLALKKEVTNTIYNAFNIPLPLINVDASTLNNYSESRIALYDNGVLPLADEMYEERTNFLFPRFRIDKNRYQITYDDNEIPALEPRRAEMNKKKMDSGIMTVNEKRALFGLPIVDGGDVILIPFGLTPLGQEQSAPQVTKSKFTEIMRQQINDKGERMFSEQDIESIAREQGLK